MANALDHRFAAVSPALVETAGGVLEIYHIAALLPDTAAAGRLYESYLKTANEIPFHRRLLQGAGPPPDGAREPRLVAADLRPLVSDLPLVISGGPNAVAAAAELLRPLPGPIYGLQELFELFHPTAGSGDARVIAASLGLSCDGESGGDSPADLCAAAYQHLVSEADALDREVLYEIARRTAQSGWSLAAFFASAAESAGAGPTVLPPGQVAGSRGGHVRGSASASNPRRRPITGGVTEALTTAIVESPGAYEARPEQLQMAAAVDSALTESHHLLVEAGTGTGKSLAYLFPAACYALRNDSRVLVSTDTINLQEQLLGKDLPGVSRLLEQFAPPDVRDRAGELRCAVLKGRRNYICLQRLAQLRRVPALSDPELRFLTRVLIWLSRGGGDRSSLCLPPDEEAIWARTCAEGTSCFVVGNPFVRDGSCQLAQARRRAEAAHLVVVNHALLLSDLAAERHVLPAYDRLIVDEAHNLEDEATNRFGFHTTQGEIAGQLDLVHSLGRDRESGLVVDVRTAVAGARSGADSQFIHNLLQQVATDVARARERLPETFGVIRSFVEQHAAPEAGYERRLLLTSSTRAQPDWSFVEMAWDNVDLSLAQIESGLERLAVAFGERDDAGMLDRETVLGAIIAAQLNLRATREQAGAILSRHDDGEIAWLTLSQGGLAGISSAPLSVGEALDASLFAAKESVVLTSATLTAGGSFDYVRQRLGVADADELALGSPFDYRRAALLMVPADMPEPSAPRYQAAVEEAIVRSCAVSRGRALVLFTSHGAMRSTARAVRGPLAQAGVRVLTQGIDGAPAVLLDALRADSATAILGTASFWEGVDVVGDALSLLIIAKLPFSVPSDPVFAARSGLFDDPFRGYSLPQAVLRFKQGFGRLIRHRNDRGVAVVLDRRVRSKSYGHVFLESLPPCTLREPVIARLGDEVASWLGSESVADRRRAGRASGH